MNIYTLVCSTSNNFLILYFIYNILTIIFSQVLIKLSSHLKIVFNSKASISFWTVFFIWELENRDPFISLEKTVYTSITLPICIYIHIYIVYTEKAMAPHSSTLAWKIPWMEEPGRLQSMGSLRVGHD